MEVCVPETVGVSVTVLVGVHVEVLVPLAVGDKVTVGDMVIAEVNDDVTVGV